MDRSGFSITYCLVAHTNINYVLQMAVAGKYSVETPGIWVSLPSFGTHICHIHAVVGCGFEFALYSTL